MDRTSRLGTWNAELGTPPPTPTPANAPPEREAERMASMFARVARGYDRLNTLLSMGMHHRWRRFAVQQCRFPAGRAGAGRGHRDARTSCWSSSAAAAGRWAWTLRADAAGRAGKLRARGCEQRAQLVVGEAERLPVPSDRFDCATIGFALRNVTDIDATFAEMARAVRPGGRVVALEIAKPRGALFRSLFLFYFYHLSPLGGARLRRRPAGLPVPAQLAQAVQVARGTVRIHAPRRAH